jgi:hypothetical protein
MMKKFTLFIVTVLLIANAGVAEETKKLTRADVIEKLSATDFFKKKIGDLLNWSVGYDITKINRTNLAPTISYIKVTPVKAPPDDRTIVLLTAKVSDPKGPDNIRGVRADLSSINRLPNTMLVDNGLWGDSKSGDLIYTLQTTVPGDVTQGSKDIAVAVANKNGWVALGGTSVDVETNPIISEARAIPESTPADGASEVSLVAKVENPGRAEDLKEVTVDLTNIGLENNVKMWDDGTHGDVRGDDKIFTFRTTIKQDTGKGIKKLQVKATNIYGGTSYNEIILVVE